MPVELEKASTHKSAKTHTQHDRYTAIGKWTQGTDAGKYVVGSTACVAGHFSRKNSAWFTYIATTTLRSV